MFVVGDEAFSTICKINKTVGYLMGVEVDWGKLWTEVMGCSAINASGIHYGFWGASIQVGEGCFIPWNNYSDWSEEWIERRLTSYMISGRVYCIICRNVLICALKFPR